MAIPAATNTRCDNTGEVRASRFSEPIALVVSGQAPSIEATEAAEYSLPLALR